MYKEQMDELYHLLRVASNEGSRNYSTEPANIVYGMAKHLLEGKDYLRLIQYCKYYGEKHLLQPTYEAILWKEWGPSRIVEFGAGLGWLCRGLATKHIASCVLTIDKRRWAATDLIADLETAEGLGLVQDILMTGDIIVMSDFLHCVVDPQVILKTFSAYPIVILEYMPTNKQWANSYRDQLERYGGNPLVVGALITMLNDLGRHVDIKELDPYILILIDKEAHNE